jgi:hypothetical protein
MNPSGLLPLLAVCLCGLLAACSTSPKRGGTQLPPTGDLVAEARVWRQEQGLVEARERLDARLLEIDAKDGWFEKRIWTTNADKSFVYPDSMATLEPARRPEIGIFLMLGFRQTGNRSPAIVARVAEHLRKEGWNAVLIGVPNRGTAAENAVLIQHFVEAELPKVKRAVMVGFSKGGYDLIEWMKNHAGDLPEVERNKIRLVVNFAGALRGSSVAAWGAKDPKFAGGAFRTLLALQAFDGADGCQDLASISGDPWYGAENWRPRSVLPKMRALQYVVLPEGPDGRTKNDALFGTIGKLAESHFNGKTGPLDGLVESAAQVYPEKAKVPQWIVRVRGSHATLDGRYANGAVVSRDYALGGEARLQSGRELMDDFLRAVPRQALGL